MSSTGSSDVLLSLGGGIGVREYRVEDTQSMAEHANNKNVWNTLRDTFPHPYTEDSAKWWIDETSKSENQVRTKAETGLEGGKLVPLNYAITVDDEAVGSIGLTFSKDIYRRSAELGYWLGEAHWGKGIMTLVVPAFVKWAWDTFDDDTLVRVDGSVQASNGASGRLLRKAGLRLEGTREKRIFKNGVLYAEEMYGAIRPELAT